MTPREEFEQIAFRVLCIAILTAAILIALNA